MKRKIIIRALIILLLLIIVLFFKTAEAEAPVPTAEQSAIVKEVKTEWTVEEVKTLVNSNAAKWNVSKENFLLVTWNESQWQAKAENKTDSHALSKGSHGVAQFSRETFNGNAKEMFEKGITKTLYTNMYNPEQALDVMGYMLSHKKGRAWTAYRTCILHEVIIHKGKQILCKPMPKTKPAV